MSDIVSIPQAIHDLAATRSTEPALLIDGESLSWDELDLRSSLAATELLRAGVQIGDLIAISSKNSFDFFISTIGCFKCGGIPMPLSHHLTLRECHEILEVAQPRAMLGFESHPPLTQRTTMLSGDWMVKVLTKDSVAGKTDFSGVISPSWKAPTSGGSTGRPKVIVATDAAAVDRAGSAGMLMRKSGRVCIPGPMYHNGPFSYAVRALAFGNTVVTTSHRFSAGATLRMVDEYAAYWLLLVPTMMHRILREPSRTKHSLDSVEFVWHVGAKCPEWLKERWISWLGPNRIFELYAGTEAQAITSIRGDEWLMHRGSVGRVTVGEMSVRNEHGDVSPTGVTGEIYMRPISGRRTYNYIGAVPKAIKEGWESLGDLGYFDSAGYLYISDRLSDMIVTGGANVYPAEVEASIEESPDVLAAVVVGVPDDELGSVIAAVVQVADCNAVTGQSLAEELSARLVRYKIPRIWRITTDSLRDDAGKVRRSSFRNQLVPDQSQHSRLKRKVDDQILGG